MASHAGQSADGLRKPRDLRPTPLECDKTDCDRVDAVEMVALNPNIVRPLHSDQPGWRNYRYCSAHATALVSPGQSDQKQADDEKEADRG